MPILPVLDLRGGLVVRGSGGRRQEYRPIVSRLVSSPEPLPVAQALRGQFGFDTLYLADLDAIAGLAPALGTYRALGAAGFRLWVDAGLTDIAAAAPLAEAGLENIVAGLETLSGPEALTRLVGELGTRLVFSLDLKEGRPLTSGGWPATAWDIALLALDAGVRRILALDLAGVGAGDGCRTEELCARLRCRDNALELTTGGGVRDIDDVRRLYARGVDYVLVASALHDGGIAPGDG